MATRVGTKSFAYPCDLESDAEQAMEHAAAKERHRPMPDRLTVWVWGSSKELLLTASVAVRASTAVGMKVILIAQLDSAASEAPQLSASAKSPASVPVTRQSRGGDA